MMLRQTTGTLLGRVRALPLTRDQLMLLMAAINELFLSLDIYLAHSTNGTITPREWIPIGFGLAAGLLLLIAGLIALRNRPLATVIANLVLLGSMLVGAVGVYFHLIRAGLVGGGSPSSAALGLLVWAPPFVGPLSFSLVGLLGISAAWIEDPANSGRLRLLGQRHIQLPYSKTRAYYLIVGMFALITVISSTFDHARTHFANPWLWLPLASGVFATVVAVGIGFIRRPTRADLATYGGAMILLLVVGAIGALLHARSNLVAENVIVVERFIRGSPLFAPLLYANVGLLGLIALLDPRERTASSD